MAAGAQTETLEQVMDKACKDAGVKAIDPLELAIYRAAVMADVTILSFSKSGVIDTVQEGRRPDPITESQPATAAKLTKEDKNGAQQAVTTNPQALEKEQALELLLSNGASAALLEDVRLVVKIAPGTYGLTNGDPRDKY